MFTFRCSEFESRLEGYGKELETFRKREVMTTEEMKNNVEKLNELSKNLDLALTEFEVWNPVMGTWDSKVWSLRFLVCEHDTCQGHTIVCSAHSFMSMFNYLFHVVFTFYHLEVMKYPKKLQQGNRLCVLCVHAVLRKVSWSCLNAWNKPLPLVIPMDVHFCK